MRTPGWWSKDNVLSRILMPVAWVYQAISLIARSRVTPVKLPVPVICVGNLTAGGAGKTPVALHIGQLLRQKQADAFFLTRGYGGKLKGPVLVNRKAHSARLVGDEPLLLAETLPTVMAKDRVSGARFAIQQGAKLIVMDDGLQNPSFVKSLSIVVIDGRMGLGNGKLIPAGPLREPATNGLRRAHAAVILHRSTLVPKLPSGIITLYGKTVSVDAELFKGKKVFAFCGIAYPQKFFGAVISTGAKLMETQAFPDHHPYTDADINLLIARALQYDAALVTTAKDMVRIPPKARKCVAVLEMAIELETPATLDGMLDFVLTPAPAS